MGTLSIVLQIFAILQPIIAVKRILRWPVFTGRAGPSISSTRFVPSPLSSKMFSSFVSDVDEVLEPELSAGHPAAKRTHLVGVSLGAFASFGIHLGFCPSIVDSSHDVTGPSMFCFRYIFRCVAKTEHSS
ncbi:hypothetical protein RB195_004681 [Necator americanus]|uniref:Uncharacterized protein n=1 Tax=Necator americanus TaxID=51031 RepID=A0ABR1BMB9_NECAM